MTLVFEGGEIIRIGTMIHDDLPLGVRLKDDAGWNQTEADWRRMLDVRPEGCFIAELDRQPADTTATCVFDSIEWIAMVPVEKSARGQGVGTRLIEVSVKESASLRGGQQ